MTPIFSWGSFVKPVPYILYDYSPQHQNNKLHIENIQESSMLSQSADWLIEQRNEWSTLIGDTGAQLDSFFAGQDIERLPNGSFLRLGLESKYFKKGKLTLEPVFRFKLDLPTLQERLKLVLESDLPEQKTLNESKLESALANEERVSGNTTGALQLIFDSAKKWRLSTSIGIRLHTSLNPFWRARTRRTWELEQGWHLKTAQNLYYFHDDGWGESTQLTFEKAIHSYFFTSTSEARWQHDERVMEFAQVFSSKKKLSAIRAIKYSVGILAKNQPNVNVTDYYFNTTYRRLIYKDWLFYDVTPELLFPREDSFKANPSILLRLEVVFSNF